MAAVPGAELVDAAVTAHERAATMGHLDAGDRAVERVVLAAGRIRVDPGDRLAGRGGDRDARVAGDDRGRPRPGVDLRPGAHPAEHVALAVELERPVGDPRRRAARDADAADGEVEPGAGRAVEGDPVEPQPRLRVLRAPVVAGHARPAGELERAAGGGDGAADPRR